MTSDDSAPPRDEVANDEQPYSDTDVDNEIESYVDSDAYKERARLFREQDRWTGDNPVLLVVDAAATTMGEQYFDQVKSQVEEFRDNAVKTGKISTLSELETADEELEEYLPGNRKQNVAMDIASELVARPESTDIDSLGAWAERADPFNYLDDPIGSINGVGLRTFQYLRMLAGVNTIKPDVQVKKFVDEIHEKLPEAPLSTESNVEILQSCYWLADHSSFSLLELDQIAWWHFANVPEEVLESLDSMDREEGLRVIVRSIDRDEFETLRWGELQDGEIVRTYDRAEDLFYSFEGYVEMITDRPLRGDGDISDEVFWLRECRSYGSQAQREKAGVRHPAIDRELQYPQGPLVGALRGLEADGSTYEDVLELDLTEPYLGRSASPDGHTVTLRYEMQKPEAIDGPAATSTRLDSQALPTAANVIEEVVKASEFEHRIDGVDVNAIDITGYLYSQTVWALRMDYETASLIDWESYEPGQLRDDADRYVNLGH